MLDYAANGTQFWTLKDIRDAYERTQLDEGVSTLADIGVEDEETFWQNVDMNLRNGKVRLLFVADVIPTSLQAIIEFLNKQIRDTEVYGLEIKQFVGKDGQKALVPTLIGRTASAVRAKSAYTPSRSLNIDDFISTITDDKIKILCQNIFSFIDKNPDLKKERNKHSFSLRFRDTKNFPYPLFYWRKKEGYRIEIEFKKLKEIDKDILEFYRVEINKMNYFRNSTWLLSSESNEHELDVFLTVVDNVINKIIRSRS